MKARPLILLITAAAVVFAIADTGCTKRGGVENMNGIPNVTEEMLNADFWVSKLDDADKVIMTADEIEAYNGRIDESTEAVADLRSYSGKLTGDALKGMIEEYKVSKLPQYGADGNMLGGDYYGALLEKRNLRGIEESNPVRFGMVVKRTNMRSLPTDDLVMNKRGDVEFDRFQETALYVGTPLAVLHVSSDGKWYFCQAGFYRGWAAAADVAIGDREQVLDYGSERPFAVVTGSRVSTGYDPYTQAISEVVLDMGVRLPLVGDLPEVMDGQATQGNLVVRLPAKDPHGMLEIKRAMIPLSEDVTVGYLPYTRGNIIRQAFKMQGERYDWGGRSGGRDCSSFIRDVYSVFGLYLPRNADEQESMYGARYDLKNKPAAERAVVFAALKPGAALYMPGHTMLYLGRVGAREYMIHDFAEYGDAGSRTAEGGYASVPVMEAAVSGLDLPRTDGRTFMDCLTEAVQIEE